MRTIALIAGVLAGALLAAPSVEAQPLRYWGKQPGAGTGWIDLGPRGYHEIEPGTEIPGWGRVKEVTNSRLVVEQMRTEAEKLSLRERGLLVYDVLEIHVLREDLRHLQPVSLPRPHR